MRQILSYFLLSILFLPRASFAQNNPKKIALIVAVGTYDPSTGWKTINSVNDVKYIKSALISQEFEEKNIDTLKNEQATKAGILKALDKLISKAGPGDIVVFHFSGHGQQIFDDEERKDELDGYDEALVPYDARMKYDPVNYRGQNHLRDDELGDKLKELRKKIGQGGSLLVLLDACHSGTATRGQDIAITRGTEIPLEPPGYSSQIASLHSRPDEGIFDDSELLSNMVVISAASADQLNYETRDQNKNNVGSLSYAFSRAISQINGDINYQLLFEKIKTEIQGWKPFQSPQIEGNTEQQVLGGKYIKTGDWASIDKWVDDKTIEVMRGAIHSVGNGAKFKLFPVEVIEYEKTTPVTTGEITAAGTAKSIGTLVSPVPDRSGKAFKIVFDSQSFGDMTVIVKMAMKDVTAANIIRQKLKQYSYISFDKPNADISITPFKALGSQQQKLQVVAANDSVLWQKDWPLNTKNSLSEEESDEIWRAIRQYSRAQYLRSIYTPADAPSFAQVEVEVVPGMVRRVNGFDSLVTRVTLQSKTNKKKELEFLEADKRLPDNEGFIIQLKNNHEFPVYLSVLDIQPDNLINVTIPDPRDKYSNAEQYKILPGKKFETRPIKVTPPYGKEFLKILITSQPLDLKGIQSRSSSRGAGTSFESFYNETFKDDNSSNSRDPKISTVKVDEIRIIPFTFNIVKRK